MERFCIFHRYVIIGCPSYVSFAALIIHSTNFCNIQACLGEIKNNKSSESVCLHINVDDKKLVLGTLNSERLPQQLFDLVFDKNFTLSHNWKNGSVYFYGYKAEQPSEQEEYPLNKYIMFF